MSHRKNFQVIKHTDAGTAKVGKATTAIQARKAATAARTTRSKGDSTWFTVKGK